MLYEWGFRRGKTEKHRKVKVEGNQAGQGEHSCTLCNWILIHLPVIGAHHFLPNDPMSPSVVCLRKSFPLQDTQNSLWHDQNII